ncbi:hypothetical protein RQP46_000710 [Phenoliferia psychrophenolica]
MSKSNINEEPSDDVSAPNPNPSDPTNAFPSAPLDTPSEPPELPTSSGATAPSAPANHTFDTALYDALVRRWPSPAARESITHGVEAFEGPTGRAPYVDNSQLSEEENQANHMEWAIAGRPAEHED